MDKPTSDDLTDIDFWSDNPGASLEDYAQAKLSPEMLLGLMQMMWPAALVHEDRVYLARSFSTDGIEQWKQTDTYRDGGMPAVQAVMNHVHVSDLFPTVADTVSAENFEFVAQVLGAAWRGRLETAFPNRRFLLEVTGDEVWISEP